MDYLGLTTTEQIRAILGLAEDDLYDEDIDARGYLDDLAEALEAKLPDYEAIIVDPDKARTVRKLRIYAKYQCAAWLAIVAQNFILKKDTDGSNELGRSDKEGYAWMAPALQLKADEAMAAALEAEGVEPVQPSYNLLTRVVPTRDPITEPRGT